MCRSVLVRPSMLPGLTGACSIRKELDRFPSSLRVAPPVRNPNPQLVLIRPTHGTVGQKCVLCARRRVPKVRHMVLAPGVHQTIHADGSATFGQWVKGGFARKPVNVVGVSSNAMGNSQDIFKLPVPKNKPNQNQYRTSSLSTEQQPLKMTQ